MNTYNAKDQTEFPIFVEDSNEEIGRVILNEKEIKNWQDNYDLHKITAFFRNGILVSFDFKTNSEHKE